MKNTTNGNPLFLRLKPLLVKEVFFPDQRRKYFFWISEVHHFMRNIKREEIMTFAR
jgi:hypothetical protein